VRILVAVEASVCAIVDTRGLGFARKDLGSAAAVSRECRAAQYGSEQYNSGMALTTLAKKLFRTLARVIPQCGMVSQAVAFNMFLAFFAVLLTALSLMKSSLEGEGGQDLALRISAIPPR
jgi:hypothetical protein